MNESRWNGLGSICVEYPPGDSLGHFLAYISLAPFVVIVSFLTLGIHNRDLPTIVFFIGQMINETINLVMKRIIKQSRPPGSHHFVRSYNKYGMPSQHSQFMAFFTSFCCLYLFFKATHKNLWCRYILIVFLISLTIGVIVSRIYLMYHTCTQCVVGAVIGGVLGFGWFRIVYDIIEARSNQIIRLPVINWFDLKPYGKRRSKRN